MNRYKIINHNNNNASYEVNAYGMQHALRQAHIEVEIKQLDTVYNFQGTRNAIKKVRIFFDDFSKEPDITILRIA